MTGWEDWGFDDCGQHRWVRPAGHIRYVVSSGQLGTFAAIDYRGLLRLPLGCKAGWSVEECRAWLDRIAVVLADMPAPARDDAILHCGLRYVLPMVSA